MSSLEETKLAVKKLKEIIKEITEWNIPTDRLKFIERISQMALQIKFLGEGWYLWTIGQVHADPDIKHLKEIYMEIQKVLVPLLNFTFTDGEKQVANWPNIMKKQKRQQGVV